MKTTKNVLPENCPQCGSPQLDRENPFGKIECQNCYWLADISDYAVGPESNWRTLGKGIYLSTLVGLTLFMGIQLVLWQKFSLEVSWILVKRITRQADVEDWLDMGAICNSLEKFECSVHAFSQVIGKQPRNRQALANLAIANCQLGDWKQAQRFFEAYFSLGGEAFDTMFWYARTLSRLGEKERGLEWYYKTLTQKADFLEAATELVDHLMTLERYEEALAFIAHLTGGHPERDVYWGQKVVSVNAFMQGHESKRKEELLEDFKVPSLNGDNYFLPIWTEDRGNVQFVLVDEGQNDVIFPRHAVDVRLIEKVMEKKDLKTDDEVNAVEIPRLRVGPWWLEDVRVSLCDDCQMRMGRGLLNQLNMKEWERFGVDFLVFSR